MRSNGQAMITPELYTQVTGQEPPADFATLEARVVLRLEPALGRSLAFTETDDDGVVIPPPVGLTHAVAHGVAALSAPAVTSVPAGVATLAVAGEYSVTMATGHVQTADGGTLPERLAYLADLGARCVTEALKHRRVAL